MSTVTKKRKKVNKLAEATKIKFEAVLEMLEQAKPFAKSLYQTDVFHYATELASSKEGMNILFENAHRFDCAGVFLGGQWEDPTKMQPPFVGASLKTKQGVDSIIELLSEMRMLAIAKGTYNHEGLSKEEATAFLNEVMALNLDLLFKPETNKELEDHMDRAYRLFDYIGNELSLRAITYKIVQELERLTVQRPIMTARILNMINMSKELIKGEIDKKMKAALEKYIHAADAATPLSKKAASERAYRLKLEIADEGVIESEAKSFAKSMKETGLVSPYHVVLLRFLNRKNSDKIQDALDLSETGLISYNANKQLVHDIIQISVYPELRQTVYGLAKMLDRGVLTQEYVINKFRLLFDLPIHAQVGQALSKFETEQSGISLNGILIAGVVSVLGQPLGIGQGDNPTCQSARAISLWAQHGINQLLEHIIRAARDNAIDMMFEGVSINSSLLVGGVDIKMDQDLDPVSLVLVPHLDKIYNEMMMRTILRGEDGHKWVNPEFYGQWIPKGFINAIDQLTLNVTNYSAFVKLFYATHHPDYNEGYELIYPNPVGMVITNVHGELLGLHAVSIQRINKDQNGNVRVYFYNPNNDSGQNWGQGILASVSGFGELEGESSLPFHEFLSRMYAFHYNPFQQGDTYMVENSVVEEVECLAKNSWGKTYNWA